MQNSSFNNFLSDGKNGFSEAEGITVLSLFIYTLHFVWLLLWNYIYLHYGKEINSI